jgi:hypothetical protein
VNQLGSSMKFLLSVCGLISVSIAFSAYSESSIQDAWLMSSAWMRNYLIDTCAELPSAEFSRIKYIQNTEDIGRSFTSFYGSKIATNFTRFMSEQSKVTLSLIDAYKKKDEVAIKSQLEAWKLNATNMCTFLNKTNPYLRFTATRNLLFDYLKRITTLIQARVNQQWQTDANEYDLFLKQTAQIGHTFAKALSNAFPTRKKEEIKVSRRYTFVD